MNLLPNWTAKYFIPNWLTFFFIAKQVETYPMGRIFLDHVGGDRLYACAACDTNLTNRDELISTRFTGATGRAFLFNKVVNLNYRYSVTNLIKQCT